MHLSVEADKETLINRVTLTLTGLPPTLPEVDAFLKDGSRGAYEKVVDRLLASPAYGEHMAAYWLNIARYSESDGFLDDYHDRLFWPYRDWVIGAFNRNMPFDQFSTWQLAGDLMPAHTKEQTLATAFLRVGKRTTENGALDEEYRVEYAVDRANTVGIGFLGMTVGCARCHDHKYDPISHKDFYALTGFFNSTDEPGFYAPGSTGITAGPTLSWTDAATEAKLSQAGATIRAAEDVYAASAHGRRSRRRRPGRRLAQRAPGARSGRHTVSRRADWLRTIRLKRPRRFQTTSSLDPCRTIDARPRRRSRRRRWRDETGWGRRQRRLRPPARRRPPSSSSPATRGVARALPSDLVRDALVWSPGTVQGVGPAVLESASLRPGVKGKAFYFDDTNRGFLAQDVGLFERTQPFSLDLWVARGAGVPGLDGSEPSRERQLRERRISARPREESSSFRPDALARRQSDSRADQAADCGQHVDPRHGHLRRLEPRLRCGAVRERCPGRRRCHQRQSQSDHHPQWRRYAGRRAHGAELWQAVQDDRVEGWRDRRTSSVQDRADASRSALSPERSSPGRRRRRSGRAAGGERSPRHRGWWRN